MICSGTDFFEFKVNGTTGVDLRDLYELFDLFVLVFTWLLVF